jgi:hypothetical protein
MSVLDFSLPFPPPKVIRYGSDGVNIGQPNTPQDYRERDKQYWLSEATQIICDYLQPSSTQPAFITVLTIEAAAFRRPDWSVDYPLFVTRTWQHSYLGVDAEMLSAKVIVPLTRQIPHDHPGMDKLVALICAFWDHQSQGRESEVSATRVNDESSVVGDKQARSWHDWYIHIIDYWPS